MPASRFFIAQYKAMPVFYLIPEMFRERWHEWVAAEPESEFGAGEPFFARRLKNLSEVNFTNPEFGK